MLRVFELNTAGRKSVEMPKTIDSSNKQAIHIGNSDSIYLALMCTLSRVLLNGASLVEAAKGWPV